MTTAKILALIMIVGTMFSSGLQLDRQQLVKTLRQYGLLGRALLANFVLLPAFAYLVVRAFHVNEDVATGILLMSMAPGVPFLVNAGGRKQGGSLAFALTITFFFAALSVVTIPITVGLLLPADELSHSPGDHFLMTLVVFQLLPLIAGALVAPRLSGTAVEKFVKALNLIFIAAAVVLVVLLFAKVVASVTAVFGFGQIAIIALVGLFAAAAGWLLGGPDRAYRRTLSIATLLRNIGLCVLIGTSQYPNSLVVPTVIAYFVITFCLSIPIRIYLQRTSALAASET